MKVQLNNKSSALLYHDLVLACMHWPLEGHQEQVVDVETHSALNMARATMRKTTLPNGNMLCTRSTGSQGSSELIALLTSARRSGTLSGATMNSRDKAISISSPWRMTCSVFILCRWVSMVGEAGRDFLRWVFLHFVTGVDISVPSKTLFLH